MRLARQIVLGTVTGCRTQNARCPPVRRQMAIRRHQEEHTLTLKRKREKKPVQSGGADMKLATVLALAGGFIAAPVIAAGNASGSPSWCDGPDCVPGVVHNVAQGAPCISATRYVFGLDSSSSSTLVCPLQGKWGRTKPLIGVRPLGAPCYGNGGAAQSPDGIPMACIGPGWNQDYSDVFYS